MATLRVLACPDILQFMIQNRIFMEKSMNRLMSGASSAQKRVDQNALRFNQVMIVALTVLAFVLGTDNGGVWLILFTGVCMAVGAAIPGKGPFQLMYRHLVLPTGRVEQRPELEDPRGPRFAQAMGAGCLLFAGMLLLAGYSMAGWALAWIVVALALVNLLFGFCTGCFIFFQLSRLMRPVGAAQ